MLQRLVLALALALGVSGCDLDSNASTEETPRLPPVQAVDLHQFPARVVAQYNVGVAQGHLRWLHWQMEFVPDTDGERIGYWQGWIEETQQRLHLWQLVSSAWVGSPLRELEELRELLGSEDYYAGRLPPPVPVYRFRRVD